MEAGNSAAGNQRLLVIDDDGNLRRTLCAILGAKGYDVSSAGSGAEGIALFRENPADLVLIDLKLPDISGIDVLASVKETSPSAEAIILTGSATLDSAIEATNRGAFSYLQKPYDMDQLLVSIRRALEKRDAEAKIVRDSAALRRTNSELETLYRISMAISRNLDMERLFPDVLAAMTGLDLFRIERRGAIFLAGKEGLRMVSSVGLPEEIRAACARLGPGECLCGMAARSGEIIVSPNSREEKSHTITYEGMPVHGHVIVPLKTATGVEGVLCLYTAAEAAIDDSLMESLRSIGNQLGIAAENWRLYEEAKTSALHDPLTGLGNRRFMQMQLERYAAGVRRYGRKLSIVMLDIDHFKRYNDTFGHIQGDMLLACLAQILAGEIRCADQIFRYGGEEFIVVLPDTDLPSARITAERLRGAVETGGKVTISLGVASCGDETRSWDTLIAGADAALYRAKRNGRNRVESCT